MRPRLKAMLRMSASAALILLFMAPGPASAAPPVPILQDTAGDEVDAALHKCVDNATANNPPTSLTQAMEQCQKQVAASLPPETVMTACDDWSVVYACRKMKNRIMDPVYQLEDGFDRFCTNAMNSAPVQVASGAMDACRKWQDENRARIEAQDKADAAICANETMAQHLGHACIPHSTIDSWFGLKPAAEGTADLCASLARGAVQLGSEALEWCRGEVPPVCLGIYDLDWDRIFACLDALEGMIGDLDSMGEQTLDAVTAPGDGQTRSMCDLVRAGRIEAGPEIVKYCQESSQLAGPR